VDNDKPAFVKAVVRGAFRGTLFDNSRKRPKTPALTPNPATPED
jgi:hypothetical protein